MLFHHTPGFPPTLAKNCLKQRKEGTIYKRKHTILNIKNLIIFMFYCAARHIQRTNESILTFQTLLREPFLDFFLGTFVMPQRRNNAAEILFGVLFRKQKEERRHVNSEAPRPAAPPHSLTEVSASQHARGEARCLLRVGHLHQH